MTNIAVEVVDLAKRFRIVHSRNRTLKATIFNGFRRTEYEEFWALDDVSFDVPEGSTFGLIGHNGSGKSTLLKCLAKIYRPDRGSVRTTGVVSALLELGAGFHPELSGRENVYLNASILGLSRREVDRKFDEIVEFAGLEQFIDSPVKNYSSGMFVRLGFAVAINVEPDVLLVDEVLAVGDEAFQQKCLTKFSDLRSSGRTVVLVSHGLDAVRNLCDRAAWLDHGKLGGVGPSGQIVDDYLESVRSARGAFGAGGRRTGGGGWEIGEVAVLGSEGKDVEAITSGGPLTVSLDVAVGRLGEVVVEVDLHRNDGVHVAGPRLRFTPGHTGRHDLTLEIPSLPLVAGSYDVSVRLLDGDVERAVARRLTEFDVIDNRSDYFGGVVSLHGRWHHDPLNLGPSIGRYR